VNQNQYSITHLKGAPLIGCLIPMLRDPLNFMLKNAATGGDIIAFNVAGQKTIILNHPDLIRHVMIDNHRNYKKNSAYIRFESAGGLGLLTSHGDKWKRGRQKIQPLFNRERIVGNNYQLVNEVSEKFKQKWLAQLDRSGTFEVDILSEMASLTTEVIMKTVFGSKMSADMVDELHNAFDVMIDYLKNIRIIAKIDMRKFFRTPGNARFQKALNTVDRIIRDLSDEFHRGETQDKNSMFSLLLEARKNDPDYFDDKEIRDQCVTMLFAGFETTSVLIHWMWYVIDGHPNVKAKLREEIGHLAPCTLAQNSSALSYDAVSRMDYLTAFCRETLRLYPSFWVIGREPLEDDIWGDFKVKKGTAIGLPQFVMHRHPKWWDRPEECLPERFLPLNEVEFDQGIYFPFAHGPRKCSGYMFAEMEAKTIMAKLVPFFDVTCLNKEGNPLAAGMSLKLLHPLKVRISRASH